MLAASRLSHSKINFLFWQVSVDTQHSSQALGVQGKRICEFDASIVYKVSSGIARTVNLGGEG